jgi:hypothetical protein
VPLSRKLRGFFNPSLLGGLPLFWLSFAKLSLGIPKTMDTYKRQIEYTCFGGFPV